MLSEILQFADGMYLIEAPFLLLVHGVFVNTAWLLCVLSVSNGVFGVLQEAKMYG